MRLDLILPDVQYYIVNLVDNKDLINFYYVCGQLRIIICRYLELGEIDKEEDDSILDVAASLGCISFIECARRYNHVWSVSTINDAILNKQYATAQWLYKHDCSHDGTTIAVAGEIGDLKLVKWLKINKGLCNENTLCRIASAGQFEILKWLYENGCIFDRRICPHAAKSGNIELVKWLHNEKKCDFY